MTDITKAALKHEIAEKNLVEKVGVSEDWLILWREVEIWYGDIQKHESQQQFLTRLSNEYALKQKEDRTIPVEESDCCGRCDGINDICIADERERCFDEDLGF